MPSYIARPRSLLMLVVPCACILLVALSTAPFSRAVDAAAGLQAAQARSSVDDSRLMVMLFDLTAMSADDVSRAANSGVAFVDQLPRGDRVSIATVTPRLRIVTDFTSDPAVLRSVLLSSEWRDAAANAATLTPPPRDGATEARLDAIRTICETVTPLPQRKALMYFSSGLSRSSAGADDQAALRDATTSCRRANVLLYPVDARGLALTRPGPAGLSR